MTDSSEITLRQRIEELRATGKPLDVAHAVGIVVPLAAELAEQHRQGYNFFLYPSALFEGQDGHYHASSRSAQPPTDPRDVACLPPESRGSTPGQARASVYGVGAILYELITLQSVGAGMRRPSDLNPTVGPGLEAVLTKALVSDPAHRPDDLNALAQAFYQINNTETAPPPPADVSHLDHDEGFDVDVSMSLLPPPPQPGGAPQVIAGMSAPLPPGMGLAGMHQPPQSQSGSAPQNEREAMLATKARLEADPRPRYVVIRGGMDHGPFAAVELLQQIASDSFEETDLIRDTIDQTEMSIADSPEFSPFARHARMGRHEKAEKVALAQAVVSESRRTMGKTFLGVAAILVVLAGVGAWFLQSRGAKSDEIQVVEEVAANVESDQGLKVKKKSGGGASVSGTKGGFPQLSGGMSCEAAINAYSNYEITMGQKQRADLTRGQLGAVLNTGSYLNACGVPSSMSVNICAAIQNGRAVGVTVVTNPRNGAKASCISSQIRRLSFPSNPKLDVTRTSFAAQ